MTMFVDLRLMESERTLISRALHYYGVYVRTTPGRDPRLNESIQEVKNVVDNAKLISVDVPPETQETPAEELEEETYFA